MGEEQLWKGKGKLNTALSSLSNVENCECQFSSHLSVAVNDSSFQQVERDSKRSQVDEKALERGGLGSELHWWGNG